MLRSKLATPWLVASMLLLGSAASAQSRPFEPLQTPTPDGTVAPLGFGDVSGDGSLDLIVTGPPYVLNNDGHGHFAPTTGSAASAGGAIADFNVDGRADVVSNLAGTWTFFYGTAFSGFVTGPTLGTVAGAAAVVAGDVNGDGAPDLVFGTSVPNPFMNPPQIPGNSVVYLNNGSGGFSSAGALGLPPLGSMGLAFADIDLDGDQDLLTSGGGVVFNAGGTFGQAVNVGAFNTSVPIRVLVGHFNNDAYPDMVQMALVSSPPPPSMFAGSPAGLTPFGPGFPSLGAGSIAVADLNLDGLDEVINSGANSIVAYAIGATGAPTPMTTLFATSVPGVSANTMLFTADIDGDGDRDLLVSTGTNNVTSLFFSDGTGGLHYQGSPFEPRMLGGGPAVADVSGDGVSDLVGLAPAGLATQLVTAVNDGTGRFSWTSVTPSGNTLPIAQRSVVAAADVDGDGDKDVVRIELNGVYGVWSAGARVVANGGGGAWNAGTAGFISSGSSTCDVVVADLNGDALEDLVFCDASTGVRTIQASPTGLMLPGTVISSGEARHLALRDADGDGDLDVFVAGVPSRLLLNSGNGSFMTDPAFPVQNATFVTAGDADGDGIVDCFLDMSLFLQTASTWTFAINVPSALPYGVVETRAFDFEGDGDIDVVSGSALAFVNLGGNVTTYGLSLSVSVFGVRMLPVDLDRDGDLDLVCSYPLQGTGNTSTWSAVVLFNTARQLTEDSPTRPGRTTHVGLRGVPGGSYQLYASTGLVSIGIPPYGTILIDPVPAIQLGAGALDAFGATDVAMPVPASFSYVGVEFDAQGVVDTVAGPRLTNARRIVIVAY